MLKEFKIKGYDFIQVQAISDEEDEAFGQDAPRGLLCLESCACLAEEILQAILQVHSKIYDV